MEIREQSWPPKQGNVLYRVTIRDINSNANIGVLHNLSESRCLLPSEWLKHPEITAMRVEVRACDEADWSTWVPFFVLGLPGNTVQWIKRPENLGGFPMRIIVRPHNGDAILLDESRMGDFPLQENLAPTGSNLRYKFMRYDHGEKKWLDFGGYMALVFRRCEPIISVTAQGTAKLPEGLTSRPYLFTVDVEVNMRYQRIPDPATAVDEHVFGITPGGGATGYGINYIMDALDARGMKGTFFVDVLMEYQVGEMETRRTIDAILDRGHDAQLHLHPNPNLYFSEKSSVRNIGLTFARNRDVTSFRGAMELAAEAYFRFTGKMPIAFRNGSYIFREEFFAVLKEFGIKIDSSIYAFKNFHAPEWMRTRTTPFIHPTGILEIPVTWMYVKSPRENRVLQHTLKIGSQARQVLDGMQEFWRFHAFPQVTLIHSYTLLNEFKLKDVAASDAKREWNNKLAELVSEDLYKIMHLDARAMKTTMDGIYPERELSLNGYLDALATDQGIRACTFTELSGMDPDSLVLDAAMDPLIEYDTIKKAMRKIGLQRYSYSYLQYLDAKGGRA